MKTFEIAHLAQELLYALNRVDNTEQELEEPGLGLLKKNQLHSLLKKNRSDVQELMAKLNILIPPAGSSF